MASTSDYQIHLNFLPFVGQVPNFCVFRREKAAPDEPRPTPGDIPAYSLPLSGEDTEDRRFYWLSLEQREDFKSCTVTPDDNHNLTKWVLFRCLVANAERLLDKGAYSVPPNSFVNELRLPLRFHKEGAEELVVQPYYLRTTNKFGLLVDFHFRLAPDVLFSRRVQQLSLSLDRSFKRNLDHYVDRKAIL